MNTAIGTGRRLRTALATALALTVLTTLVVVETASAATLSERLATRTATKLVKKQLADEDRNLVEARISVGERVSRNVYRFLYDDLNREGEICTGVIDVRLSGTTIRGRFLSGSTCEAPGDGALAVRNATRAAARQFLRAEPALRRSVRRYTRAIAPCESLEVPTARRDEATLLLSTGLVQATFGPLAPTLDGFATTLGSLGLAGDQLEKGALAWRDFVDGARSLPTLSPDACAVLAEWAANGFSDETAPVDFAALRTLMDRLEADGAEVRRTSRFLARLGIDPLTAVEFSFDDLIGTTVVSGDDLNGAAARVLAR